MPLGGFPGTKLSFIFYSPMVICPDHPWKLFRRPRLMRLFKTCNLNLFITYENPGKTGNFEAYPGFTNRITKTEYV